MMHRKKAHKGEEVTKRGCRGKRKTPLSPDFRGVEGLASGLGLDGRDRGCFGWGRRGLLFGLCVLGLMWGAACKRSEEGSEGKREAKGEGKRKKPLVVCTTTIIEDMARRVAGEALQVRGLMKAGVDPHTYTPRPEDGMWMRKAALVLVNGLHLEGKLIDMIENAGKKALALGEDPAIPTRKGMGVPDPHVWWDIRFFQRYVEKARDGFLPLVAEEEKAGLRERASAYIGKLQGVDAWAKAAIQTIPKEQRLMITSHDAFYYFGAAYGLEVDAVLGVSTEAQAKAAEPLRLADQAAKRRIPALFHETSVSKEQNDLVDSIQRLAWLKHKHRLTIAGPLYSDSLDERDKATGSYIGAFVFNVRSVVKALGGRDIPFVLAKEATRRAATRPTTQAAFQRGRGSDTQQTSLQEGPKTRKEGGLR